MQSPLPRLVKFEANKVAVAPVLAPICCNVPSDLALASPAIPLVGG